MKSRIGQVFLKDTNIKSKICHELKRYVTNDLNKVMVEVGLGNGDMTKFLIDSFPDYKFFGVEVDPFYAAEVDKLFGKRMIVYNESFLDIDLEEIKEGVLFSNVPYHLTTKFIQQITETINRPNFHIVAITIQKEAYERLLKSSIPIFYAFKELFVHKTKVVVKRQCFKPIPHVDSVFSVWERKHSPFEESPKLLLRALNMLNNKRNKTMRNNLLFLDEDVDSLISEPLLTKRFNELKQEDRDYLIRKVINHLITNHNKM